MSSSVSLWLGYILVEGVRGKTRFGEEGEVGAWGPFCSTESRDSKSA